MKNLREELMKTIYELTSIPRGKTIIPGYWVDEILGSIINALPNGQKLNSPNSHENAYLYGKYEAMEWLKQILIDAKSPQQEGKE